MEKQDAPQRSKEALAAAVKAELSRPIIPGEIMPMDGEIELFKGRETKEVTVTNVGDRPIQVASHCHFLNVIERSNFPVNRRSDFG